MSDDPHRHFSKASKLVESFVSFCEKLAYCSEDPEKHLKDLVSFKRNAYFNIHSQSKLRSAFKDLLPEETTTTVPSYLKSSDNLSAYNPSPPKPFTANLYAINFSQPKEKEKKLQIFPSDQESDTISSQGKPLQGFLNNANSTWTKPESIHDLLIQIKASIHLDYFGIKDLTQDFSDARSFSHPQESIYYALCFSFFEKFVKDKFNQPRMSIYENLLTKLGGLDNDIETLLNYLDKTLSQLIKTATTRTATEDEVRRRFYEEIATNFNLYNSCLVTFKKIITKVSENKGFDALHRRASFKWMNEFNNTDHALFQGLADLLEIDLQFYILTQSKLTEKFYKAKEGFSFAPSYKPNALSLDILFDKSSNFAFVLYKSKDAVDGLYPLPSKRNRQRSHTPNVRLESGFSESKKPLTPARPPKSNDYLFLTSQAQQYDDKTGLDLPLTRMKKAGTVVDSNPYSIYPSETSPPKQNYEKIKPTSAENLNNILPRAVVLGTYNPTEFELIGSKVPSMDNLDSKLSTRENRDKEIGSSRGSDYLNFKEPGSYLNTGSEGFGHKSKVSEVKSGLDLPLDKDYYLKGYPELKSPSVYSSLNDLSYKMSDHSPAKFKEEKAVESPFAKRPVIFIMRACLM